MEEPNSSLDRSKVKTLRRKPPPDLVTESYKEEFSNYTPVEVMQSSVSTVDKEIFSAPSIPPRPKISHRTIANSMNLTIDIESAIVEGHNEYHLTSSTAMDNFFDSSIDDSHVSFESPKPMGPKGLLEYDDNISINKKQTRQRKFQQLSRPEASPVNQIRNPPYPLNDIQLDLEFTSESSEEEDEDNDDYELTPSSSPSKWSTHSRVSPSSQRGSEITSSTRIPSIHSPNTLLYSTLSKKSLPNLKSPTWENNTATYIASNQPPHNSNRTSRYILNLGKTDVAERSSRSPSPKKLYGRSPSLMYNPFNNSEYSDEKMNIEFESTDANITFSSSPTKWTSIHTIESGKSDNSDFHISQEDLRIVDSPSTNYFDYSILPELPDIPITPVESSSPSKRLTLNSAISFKKGESDSLVKNRKRNDSLPPVPLDLPILPFSSSSLVTQHFSTCLNVWSLSNLFKWLLKIREWTHDSFISKREFKKALIKLLIFHKSDIPLDSISKNADQIISSLLKSEAIKFTNPANKVDPLKVPEVGILMNEKVSVNGVMTELIECYSGSHDNSLKIDTLQLLCYSYDCTFNRITDYEKRLKNTNIKEIVLGEDWASHWKLTAEDLEQFHPNVSKRQSLIFDLLRYEQTFISRAECFLETVAPEFIKAIHGLVDPSEIISINKFEEDLLNPGSDILRIHREDLFEPLLRILISDGILVKAVAEIAEIYTAWAKKVKRAMLMYISTIPMIEHLLKNESIKSWVDFNVRNMKKVKELKVNGSLLFLSTFNSRYQSLPLQLSDIRKSFEPQDTEYISLTKAISAIKKLGIKANDMKMHADNIYALKEIESKLVWKSNVSHPTININSENRKFFFRGDLAKKGDLKINSSTNHVILLDNYLFITDKVKNSKMIYSYRVIENPIPIELLIFEEKEPGLEFKPIAKNLTSSSSPHLPEREESEVEPSTFPFKIRYAGRGKHNSFTFSAKSEKDRKIWLNQLTKARSNLCLRLRKNEPYELSLISNTCFAYENNQKISKLQICTPHDPIYQIATDSKLKLEAMGLKGDLYNFDVENNRIVFSSVLCATSFKVRGEVFYLVGLASGIYCSDLKSRWKKVINGSYISKITVDTNLNLLIVLGNKHLRYYVLDSILGIFYERRETSTCVSLSKDSVMFFSFTFHKEIPVLFYAKRRSTSTGITNFSVMLAETDNEGVFSSFKLFKEFFIQAECYGISVFNKSFTVHTSKGFEVLELDKLLPRAIPEIPYGDKKFDGFNRKLSGSGYRGVELIRKAVFSAGIKPKGMFKLTNNTEFILVYSDCAIFINKHGKLSRFSMLRFGFKAKSIAFKRNILFIVSDEVIEIWSISDFINGSNRIIQVITGKDINMLGEEDSICFSMANPEVLGMQLLFKINAKELVS